MLLAAVCFMVISLDRLMAVVVPPPSELNAIIEPHPRRGWAHRRSVVGSAGVTVRTNALGFRGPEISPRKPPNEFRILFIGDSITFGYRLEADELWVSQAEGLLNDAAKQTRFLAMNAGVGAYTTWQELDVLRDEGARCDPDLVVLQFCFNDVDDLTNWNPSLISGVQLPFEFSTIDHWSGFVRAGRSWLAHRRFEKTLAELRFAHQQSPRRPDGGLFRTEDLHREPISEEVQAAWDLILTHLDEFDDLCRSRRLPWVFVVFPLMEQLEIDDPRLRPQKYLADWAARRGVHHLDLLPIFRDYMAENGRKPRHLMFDPTHPTSEGSRIAAEALRRLLNERQLIPSK
jgi:lysophospholipase L1-like esterase